MSPAKYAAGIFVLFPLFFASCLYSRSTAQVFTVSAGIKIFSGNAAVNIYGRISEDLYLRPVSGSPAGDGNYHDNPVVMEEGAITADRTITMGTGDECTFSVLPAEVVTVNIKSLDGNDVVVISRQHGRERKYTVKGDSVLGLSIAFQNR